MLVEIKIPSPGESINEVEISSWLVSDGDIVIKNQEIAMIESDKATLSLIAEESGKITILKKTGIAVKVNEIACTIDTAYADEPTIKKDSSLYKSGSTSKSVIQEKVSIHDQIKITPLAKKIIEENKIEINKLNHSSERIFRKDVEKSLKNIQLRGFDRVKMSMLRRKLSQRLVAVKNETAMLTTFNEIDMGAVMAIRKQYQDQFKEKYGLKLGFMSFFTKAVSLALQAFPNVNAMIEGDETIYYKYSDIAIAVQTDKGLMAPVIRNSEQLSIPEIEIIIAGLAEKARSGKITMEELTGGTFTISNGGVFGSLLSTPILNPPQSGILGMHNIVERPVAISGKVEIRPMMYVALSYDHRVIDGRDSVGFLLKVKELIEYPEKFISEKEKTIQAVLGL